MPTVSASVARQTLPAQLDAVERGEQVSITRHGKVVAVLVPPGRTTARSRAVAEALAAADEIGDQLRAARDQPLTGPGISPERAEELIREIRAGRDAR